MKSRIGTIEKIKFTSGGAGNQWTTIDGTRYATWWSFGDGVKVGAEVEYQPYRQRLFGNSADEVDCANIRRVSAN